VDYAVSFPAHSQTKREQVVSFKHPSHSKNNSIVCAQVFLLSTYSNGNSDWSCHRYSRCMSKSFSVNLTAPKATALLSAFSLLCCQ